ncbi:hypothetical protein [Pleionea litopenaei]|uniref:Uncharacterized protein n=1 Tax=Pleionea litopenaei TaxID=3070815 RepID=A0AA51RXD9_9GAMM|nr:hypothetical protein [Pleionea sp. HL-JVS1]WMS89285.1 hypothetical protein Q9312_19310 [Pleionea sp. HL-JVS1]WMS89306.1 hypothetical protein Q9312_19200 [Pleionea sp. HL-JVS1]
MGIGVSEYLSMYFSDLGIEKFSNEFVYGFSASVLAILLLAVFFKEKSQ